jgi:hypothetical protein
MIRRLHIFTQGSKPRNIVFPSATLSLRVCPVSSPVHPCLTDFTVRNVTIEPSLFTGTGLDDCASWSSVSGFRKIPSLCAKSRQYSEACTILYHTEPFAHWLIGIRPLKLMRRRLAVRPDTLATSD